MTYSKRKSIPSYLMWLQLYFVEDFTYNCLLKFFTHENYLIVLELEVASRTALSSNISIPFDSVLIQI